MLTFFALLIKAILNIFKSKKNLVYENLLLKKQNQIYNRKLNNSNKKIAFKKSDKTFLVLINMILNSKSNFKNLCSIVKHKTILRWQRNLVKSFWTFPKKNNKPGRPPIPAWIKNLVLKIKNQNLFWGNKKIQGELQTKLDIDISETSVRNIIKSFRKKGKVKVTGSWKKFLNLKSLDFYATDFLTIDTIFNKRFYIFFIISHSSRKIVQTALTANPTKIFIKQQLISFEENFCRSNNKKSVVLIHDNGSQYILDYNNYNIKGVATSIAAPNMNAIAERFVRTIKEEAFDHFLIFSDRQVKKILNEYIYYYNNFRPHQGLSQNTPSGYEVNSKKGKIRSITFLHGLHRHYFYDNAA